MLSEEKVVFLLDVDNTLLDNDRFGADLGARLEQAFGADKRDRYWAIFTALREEQSYADYLAALQRFRVGLDGDPELLHKAFQNLVLNALDAMPAGGTLTFRTADTRSGVRIEVEDSGKGLTPEECSRLFTPYYTTKSQGTGLGLAIVQSVISDHRGTISVSSEQGHGTRFRIELPRRQPGLNAKRLPAAASDQPAPATPETAAASD